jgi:hypothetical protein
MAKQTINPRRRLVWWLLALFSGAAVLSASAATSDWTWVTTGCLQQPSRAFHSATLVTLSDGSSTAMVVGGLTNKTKSGNPEELATSEILKGKDWTYGQSLNTARQWHTATLYNGLVLVAGGKKEEMGLKSQSSCELLDPKGTGTGTFTGALNEARDQHTATLLGSGQVLVVGGEQMAPPSPLPVNNNLASCELYNGTKWDYTGKLATARNLHTATLLDNEMLLVVGGYYMDENNNRIALKSCELYNPGTGQWETGGAASPPLQHPRGDHRATKLADGRVLVAGGQTDLSEHPQVLASYEIYAPDPDHPGQYKWTCPTDLYPRDPSKRLPFPCSQHSATLLKDGTVLLVAGENSMIYIPDPDGAGGPGDTWTYDYLNFPRTLGTHTATRLKNDDGWVLVAGGGADQCEIWQPLPATLPAGVSAPMKRLMPGK